jgi:hypothetical protein
MTTGAGGGVGAGLLSDRLNDGVSDEHVHGDGEGEDDQAAEGVTNEVLGLEEGELAAVEDFFRGEFHGW